MQIQFNTDNNIAGKEETAQKFSSKIEQALDRFGERITRVEIYLSDLNSHKEGQDDKRCVLEARLNGLEPITVTHQAESIDFAFNGARDKLKTAIENKLGKLKSY